MRHQPVRKVLIKIPGTTCPTFFNEYVGSLTSPANHVTIKIQETGPMVYRVFQKFIPI